MNNGRKLKVLDLFSGIGGFSLGLERTGGFETVAFCEIDPFCRRVLAKHWPGVPIHDDVRELTADAIGPVDIIVGGYPCQPFSTAGKRRGAEDDRHLWPEVHRLVAAIRPAWCLFENVAGHISMGLDEVLSDLEGEGYTCWPLVIPACGVDAPHRRDRVWIIAHAGHTEPQGRGQPTTDNQGRSGKRIQTGGKPTSPRPPVAHPNSEWQSQSQGIEQNIRRRTGNGGQDVAHAGFINEQGQQPSGPYPQKRQGPEQRQTVSRCDGVRWWPPEPNVGRVVARVSTRMDGDRLDADASNDSTDKILSALRIKDRTKTVQWPSRRYGGIQEAEVLLSIVCEYEGPPRPLGNASLARPEAPQEPVRGVWFNGSTACSSCRREAREQRTKEHPDTLRILSQLLTCDCGAAWLDRTGTPSAASRVDRLRCLGNAVVPQIPEVIGSAILEAEGLVE